MNDFNTSISTLVPFKLYFIEPTLMDALSISNNVILSELVGVFGIVGNVINTINFRRQGFLEGVNVTLFSLALCDLGALVAHQFSNILFSPWIGEYDLFMLKTHLFVVIFYVNGYFVRVGGLLTSFMTFERCICVVWPLRVKGVFTARTAAAVNVSIAVITSLYLFPPFYVVTIDWTFIPSVNRTILAEIFKSNRHSVMTVYYIIADQFLPYGTILILILCTILIITRLRSKLRWRQSVSTPGGNNSSYVTPKERKVVKMLITISVIFIVCLLPQSSINVAMGLVPGLKMDGIFINIYKVCYSFTSILETINCSVSILVYYNMSVRYRQVFWDMFHPLKCFLDVKSKQCKYHG